nr:MAG TPA: hypothetical protein [Caudoviricetes sp.]
MSEFSIYRESIRKNVVFDRGSCTCGSSLLVAGVGALARLLSAGPISQDPGSGICACTIDRVANIDHNEGDGTSIFWTLFFAIPPRLITTTLPSKFTQSLHS